MHAMNHEDHKMARKKSTPTSMSSPVATVEIKGQSITLQVDLKESNIKDIENELKKTFEASSSQDAVSLQLVSKDPFLLQLFSCICSCVVNALYPQQPIPSHVNKVYLIVRTMEGVAHCCCHPSEPRAKEIHLSLSYLMNYYKQHGWKRVLHEIMGVLYHEMVHVWQYDGSHKSKAPHGIIEGIADYYRLKAGLSPSHWSRSKGGSWKQGYETTGYFLEYIEQTHPGWVVELNQAIKEKGWNRSLFKEKTGKSLSRWWRDYQHSFEPDQTYVDVGSEEDSEASDTPDTPSYPIDFDSNLDTLFTQQLADTLKEMAESLHKVEYSFINGTPQHPGSVLFGQCVEKPEILLKDLSLLVVKILYADPPSYYPYFIESIELHVREMDGVAYCTGSKTRKELHFSSNYLEQFYDRNNKNLDLLFNEIKGVLVHELTHCWQWSDRVTKGVQDRRPAPGGVIEGMADYVRLTSKFIPSHWKRIKTGNWDAGYAHTAYFFEYIETSVHNFVRKMNYLIGKQGWSTDMFVMLTGKSVEELWKDYCSQ